MDDATRAVREIHREPPFADEYLSRVQDASGQLSAHDQIVWQVFTVFLLADTLFLGFSVQLVLSASLRYLLLGFALVGEVITLIWYLVTCRLWDYHRLYQELAREAEVQGDLRIHSATRDRAAQFGDGHEVTINGRRLKTSAPARLLGRTRTAAVALIAVFLASYGALAAALFP